MSEHQEVPPPPELRGEAPPGAYGMLAGNNAETDPSYTVFPIVRYDPEGHLHLLGTGFFIATNGLFVTARHVLMDTFDADGREKYPIGIIQFLRDGVFLQRPILRCAQHPTADVAVGVAAPMTNNLDGLPVRNPVLTLIPIPPGMGTRVMTYAYPKHANIVIEKRQIVNLAPAFYDGEMVEYFPIYRDRVMLPAPCYRTSIIIHGGASGGPVFSRSGWVFGVNSTGIDGTDVSYVSRINEVFDLTIDSVVLNEGAARSVPVTDIVRAGHILVKPALDDVAPLLAHLGKA